MPLSEPWLDALPPDFYAQLTHTLNLHGMAALELLSRPATPAANHLQHLTGLDVATVQRLNGIGSHAQLLAALRQEPLAVYHLLLLGGLTLETNLATPVLAYVRELMGITDEQLGELLAYCRELSGAFLGQLEEHLPAPAGAAASLGLHRLGVEEAFAGFVAELPAPPVAAAKLRLTEAQLHMLQLALLLVQSLPTNSEHPFLRAVAALPNLQHETLEPLTTYLGQIKAQDTLTLTMPELVQLYQAMQVCGMVFVSDVTSQLGLEDAFPILPDEERQASTPASNRQVVGEIVSGFTHWVQHTFPENAEIEQAREQVLKLADAL